MPAKIFFCYAHEDGLHLNKLKTHLRPLQLEGLIDLWHDREISAGTEWEPEIDKHLNEAEIILLLISPDFMSSDYCYSIELKKAIGRHKRKEARVIPVILRPAYWQIDPLSKLQALPTDAKPVISSYWHNLDEAFLNITQGIHKLAVEMIEKPLITAYRKVQIGEIRDPEEIRHIAKLFENIANHPQLSKIVSFDAELAVQALLGRSYWIEIDES